MKDHNSKELSNSQRAVKELRELIFTGELAAGSDHLESELAERLGMSRTPVREAALTLASQGLLQLRPRKGVRISPISADDMREVYDVLTLLESYSAQNAAKIGYTAKEMQDLGQFNEDMIQAIDRIDLKAWAEADEAFHRELVVLGKNKRALSVFDTLSDQMRRVRSFTLYARPLPTKSNEDHTAVYQAILEGDARTAQERHMQHGQYAKQVLVDLLEKLGLNRV